MQYIRLYVNALGIVEHIETSTRPLPNDPAITIQEPVDPQIPDGPHRLRPMDLVVTEFESQDGRFHRAKDLLRDMDVDSETLVPRFKPMATLKGTLRKMNERRAIRG
jgi:hypothetical protein